MIPDKAIAGEELKGGDPVYIAADRKYYKSMVNITTPAGPMSADEAAQMMQDAIMGKLEPELIRFAECMKTMIDAANRIWDSLPGPAIAWIARKERKRERYFRRYRNIGRRNGKR